MTTESSVLIVVGAVAVALLGFVLFLRRRPGAFLIQMERGKAELVEGHVAKAFVTGCSDVGRLSRIVRGEIRGVRNGEEISLDFSGAISPAAEQRFRNLWAEVQGGRSAISRIPKQGSWPSDRLVRMCGGDRNVAERLVRLEMRRAQGIDEAEADRRAIDELKWDRR